MLHSLLGDMSVSFWSLHFNRPGISFGKKVLLKLEEANVFKSCLFMNRFPWNVNASLLHICAFTTRESATGDNFFVSCRFHFAKKQKRCIPRNNWIMECCFRASQKANTAGCSCFTMSWAHFTMNPAKKGTKRNEKETRFRHSDGFWGKVASHFLHISTESIWSRHRSMTRSSTSLAESMAGIATELRYSMVT